MDQQAREQAFISALTTEQFVLQAAHSANVGEMTGRGTVYMGTVSSSLIAFGFLAQVTTHLDPFVAAVLPAVFLLGEFTFAALVRNTLENLVLLGQMQRIRSYYATLVPEAQQFFDPSGTHDALAVAMATSGNRASPVEMLFTAAAVIAAVNSILGGAGLALLAGTLTPLGSAGVLAIGVVGTVIVFGLHLLYGYRRAAPTAGWPPLMVRRRLPPPPQASGSGQDRPLASPLQPAARTEQPPEMILVEQRPGNDPDA
jgi:hypothetical protein